MCSEPQLEHRFFRRLVRQGTECRNNNYLGPEFRCEPECPSDHYYEPPESLRQIAWASGVFRFTSTANIFWLRNIHYCLKVNELQTCNMYVISLSIYI